MTPEQKARQQIDRQLEQAGWIVQDYRQMNITAGLGVAVREFLLTTGDADYMLYADAKAIGVVEAKPKGHTLTGVETQSGKYLDGLPAGLPHHRLPLPFAYESTGEVTQFTNIPGLPWHAVITQHFADTAHALVAEYLRKDIQEFGSEEQRIEAWIAAVKARDPKVAASRATWHRYRDKVEDLLGSSRKPERIVLERNAPPVEVRPFDSLVGVGVEREEPLA